MIIADTHMRNYEYLQIYELNSAKTERIASKATLCLVAEKTEHKQRKTKQNSESESPAFSVGLVLPKT